MLRAHSLIGFSGGERDLWRATFVIHPKTRLMGKTRDLRFPRVKNCLRGKILVIKLLLGHTS